MSLRQCGEVLARLGRMVRVEFYDNGALQLLDWNHWSLI